MGTSGCLRLPAALIEWCLALIKHNAAEFHHDQINLSCLARGGRNGSSGGNGAASGGLQREKDQLRIAESEWQDGWMENQFTPGRKRKIHRHISTSGVWWKQPNDQFVFYINFKMIKYECICSHLWHVSSGFQSRTDRWFWSSWVSIVPYCPSSLLLSFDQHQSILWPYLRWLLSLYWVYNVPFFVTCLG